MSDFNVPSCPRCRDRKDVRRANTSMWMCKFCGVVWFTDEGSDGPTMEEAIVALRNLWNTAQDVISTGDPALLYEDKVLLNAEGVLARYEEANELL